MKRPYSPGNNTTLDGDTVIISQIKSNKIKGFMKVNDEYVEMTWDSDGTYRGLDKNKSLKTVLSLASLE